MPYKRLVWFPYDREQQGCDQLTVQSSQLHKPFASDDIKQLYELPL